MKHFITIINYSNFNIIYLLLTIDKFMSVVLRRQFYITLSGFNCLTTFIIIRNIYDVLTSTGMSYIIIIKRFVHPYYINMVFKK